MKCNTAGLLVHHQLPEFTQTHIHRVCDAIQPSHPLLSPFLLPSFPGSRSLLISHLSPSVGQSTGASASASVFPMDIQVWFPLGLTGLILCRPRDSKESFPALQLESISSLALSLLYGPTFTSEYDYWKNHSLTIWTFVSKAMSLFIKCCLGLS